MVSFPTAYDYIIELYEIMDDPTLNYLVPVIKDFLMAAQIMDELQGASQRSVGLGVLLAVLRVFGYTRERMLLLTVLQQVQGENSYDLVESVAIETVVYDALYD